MSREELEKLCATLLQTGCATFIGEAWLKDWKKSTSTALPQITINVAEDPEVEPFEAATVKKGKIAGQRYKVLFFEISDDEELIETKPVKLKGGKLSIEAAGLCNNLDFQKYVARTGCEESERGAKTFIYDNCCITSRAEIDHDASAARRFRLIKSAFADR